MVLFQNIVMYLNKYFAVRLPYFTCGDCLLKDFFYNMNYFWLIPVIFIHWHLSYTQFWLTSLMAFDRFVVIVLGLSKVSSRISATNIAIITT